MPCGPDFESFLIQFKAGLAFRASAKQWRLLRRTGVNPKPRETQVFAGPDFCDAGRRALSLPCAHAHCQSHHTTSCCREGAHMPLALLAVIYTGCCVLLAYSYTGYSAQPVTS